MLGWLKGVVGRWRLPRKIRSGATAKAPALALADNSPGQGSSGDLPLADREQPNPFWTKAGLAGYLAAPRPAAQETPVAVVASVAPPTPAESAQTGCAEQSVNGITDTSFAMDVAADGGQEATDILARIQALQALAASQAAAIERMFGTAAAGLAFAAGDGGDELAPVAGQSDRRVDLAAALKRVQIGNRPSLRAAPARRKAASVPLMPAAFAGATRAAAQAGAQLAGLPDDVRRGLATRRDVMFNPVHSPRSAPRGLAA